jgi:FkbM family methyltransferase
MSIRFPLPGKTIAQSLIPAASRGLAWENTDVFLCAAGAYISSLRGLGWSPHLHQEAVTAAHWLDSKDGFVAIDAGANVGSWTALFRKQVPYRGRIYAFEPQRLAAEKIRELQVEGCQVIEMALGRTAGTRTFHTLHPTDSMGSLYERHDTFAMGRERQQSDVEVEVVRLDDFVEANHIDMINFMKMDLEGAELEALNGASECMRTGLLRAISFEFGISNVNARVFFRDLFDLLTENHYEIFRMTPAGRLIGVKRYSEDLEVFARTSTYFARVK